MAIFTVNIAALTKEILTCHKIVNKTFLPEIYWEKITEEILFVFRFDVWPGARTLAFNSNKPTHCLLDHQMFWIITHLLNNLLIVLLLFNTVLDLCYCNVYLQSLYLINIMHRTMWKYLDPMASDKNPRFDSW